MSHSFAPAELAAKLTALGIEVEAIEDFASKFTKIVVGEVLEVSAHPNADKLRLTLINIGEATPLHIVCGAPNVSQGQKVAVATIGANLGEGFVIKKSKIRGEVSEGMLCSERELGLSESHAGIMVLPDNSIVGTSLAEALGKNDVIFEIGLTPNRADCLSHIGVAREVAMSAGTIIKRPTIDTEVLDNSKTATSSALKVTIENPDLCPRYIARVVSGVKIGPSPEWLRQKLEAVGLRPRNNIVDVTNFVLMECGHPLHAFDLGAVKDSHIIVRTASGFASKYTTLDGKQRDLDPETLLIADAENPLAIAGIMGGENSEITDSTTDVLIESAYFNPTSIRRSAKKLGLSTDASHRFERGTDIDNLTYAVDRAATLMAELAGGEVLSGRIDEYPNLIQPKTFSFRPERAGSLLGTEVESSKIERIFSGLQIGVEKSPTSWTLTSPSWRVDLEQEVDAIEEIARVIGYDSLPVSTTDRIPMIRQREVLPVRVFDSIVRSELISLGFTECVSTPMLSGDQAKSFHASPVEVMNPLTVELERMRPSIIPNLLEIARRNERFGATGQRIFEDGKVFHYADSTQFIGNISEKSEIALLIKDSIEEKNPYNQSSITADLLHLRNVIEQLLTRLGIIFEVAPLSGSSARWKGAENYFASGNTIIFRAGGKELCIVGKVNSSVQSQFDLRTEAHVAVIDHNELFAQSHARALNPGRVKPLPKFPAVERDIAFVLKQNVAAGAITEEVQKLLPKDLVESVSIFDEFVSKEMKAATERSLGVRITLRSQERTLEDSEIDVMMLKVSEGIVNKYQARIRA